MRCSRTCAAFAGRGATVADLALDGVDLSNDVDHRVVSFRLSEAAAWRRRSRLPRASSVSSESRRWPQNAAEVGEPVVELAERRRVDGVEPAGALGSDVREPAVAQDLEVLRHGRLRDPELGLDDGRDRPRGQLAIGEQFEDPPADRVSEDVERVHEHDSTRRSLI